ncbi:MAG: flagellar filament capping protein FliD [Nitrospirae bacterium]|nr:flagellar filament capping protein FliD [Nitrospirota bacterium]
MTISSSGLVSGLNVDQLVQQVQDAQKQPITTLQARQATYQKEIGAIQSVSTKLSTLLAVTSSVNNPANFNTNSVSVGNTATGATLLSATADSTATNGTYAVSVKQLAKASKLAAAGFVDQNATGVASADGTFKFKVGNAGTEYSVGVSAGTTLQALRDSINATGGTVTATIINDGTGSNPYRLILTANTSGGSNSIAITNNDTSLDFTNKKVEAAYAFTGNSYAGTVTSNAGNNYTGSTSKTFLIQAVTGGAPGAATYKYSIDGGLTYLGYGGAAYSATAGTDISGGPITAAAVATAIGGTAGASEGVTVGFGAGTMVAGDRFSVDVFAPTFQTGQDAVVVVDGTTYTKATNNVADIIQGVTLNLQQADSTNGVNVTVTSDASAAVAKIKNFVTAYNDFNTFLNGQLNYDPTTKLAGPLLGDPAVRAIQRQLKDVVSGQIPGLTTGKANLSQIGITSNSKTGALTVNDTILSSAISSDPTGVRRLFLGIGTPSNSAITFLGLTSKTEAGSYGINIATAPLKAVLGGASSTFQDLSTTGLTNPESLSFSYSGDYAATIPTTTSFNVTLSAGLKVNDIVSALNSSFSTNGVGLSASSDSGKLKITSKDYGADVHFTVVSDQAGVAQTGIGSVGRSAQGTDIAGSINNYAATGKANALTSHSGFTEDGLAISTESTSVGLFGSVTVTRGVGDRLVSSLATYTDPTVGILTAKSSGLQKNVDRLTKDIKTLNDRITTSGDSFRAQLVRLETVLGKFQTTSNFLTNQLAKLSIGS